MQVTESTTTIVEELDAPGDVLGFIRLRRAEANAAEVDVLSAATVWAEQHPVDSIHDAAVWPGTTGIGGETGLALAGQGAPLVAEFCVAELAVALGVSTDSGRILMAHGLGLKYRLGRLHRRGAAREGPGWRGRAGAGGGRWLPPAAAGGGGAPRP